MKKVREVAEEQPTSRKFVLRLDVGNVERAVLAHPMILLLLNSDFGEGNGYPTEMCVGNQSVPLAES